tara:strand:- start:629 stop:844 length:216 start_codon:yes stop_codon:yes gene_type:complete
MRCVPPRQLVVMARDGGKYEKNACFECEFVYFTVECCDFDMLDEIILGVKAEVIQAPQRFVKIDNDYKPTK